MSFSEASEYIGQVSLNAIMSITIKKIEENLYRPTVEMITDFFNYHKKLTNAPKEFWQVNEESEKDLKEWLYDGHVYNIFFQDELIGFIHLRFGGHDAAWLEDIFIAEEYRGKGLGKEAIKEIDKLMEEKNIKAMFVDVIPRNSSAIKLYKECGFDHLNMIQLRKNYDKTLNKSEHIEVLGFDFIKY